MDKIAEEDNSLQTKREPTSPPSLKRPRTHCTVTNDGSGESSSDFPELLIFDKTTDFPSSQSILQKNVICSAENRDIQGEKPCEQLQDIKSIITPITKVTTSCTDDADTLSSEICVITAERHLAHLGKDEQALVTVSDKFFSYLPDMAGEALVESYTPRDTNTDMSSHPDCKCLGKSLEDEPCAGCCLFTGNDKDGRKVQHSVIQIQAFTHRSNDDEVRCQSDCSHHAGFCNTLNQYDEVEVSDEKCDEHIFSENILLSKEEEEGNCPQSCSHFADCKLNYSYSEDGNFAEDLKNKEKLLQLQICENNNFAICDGETKVQVNENGTGKNSILFVSECAEGSVVPCDVVLSQNTAIENVSPETDDLCGVKGEHAAGKMIAKAWNETTDHTTEAPISPRISQVPAEGDNNAGIHSVIDPTIWSETAVSEAEEKHCNSASTAGVELSPSIKVCEMETPPPLCLDVKPSQEVSASNQIMQSNHQSTTQQCKNEKGGLCQSYIEPQACSIITNETHSLTVNQGSSPCYLAKLYSGGGTVVLQLKEQDQSDSFPISLDNLRTQEAEQAQVEISRIDGISTIKERQDMKSSEEIKNDEHVNVEKVMESEDELLHHSKLRKEACDCASDSTDGEICECDDRLTCVKEDHPYSADVPMIDVEKERKEVKDVGEEMKTDGQGYSEVVVKRKDNLQQQNKDKTDTMDLSHMECISEWTEANMSPDGNTFGLVSQYKLRNKLSPCHDYRHRAEAHMVENTDDLVAFTSPPTSDAIVPHENDCSNLQNANSLTTLNRSGRFSPVPSAITFHNRVPEGFDTFEKIQLSPDVDNDDDDGLINTSFLSSLSGQLLKTPQQQLYHSMPQAESHVCYQAPDEKEKEEEEGEEECHTEYSTDTSCNDIPNFISAADVIALEWSEQQPNCESSCDFCEAIRGDVNTQSKSSTASTESERIASDVKDYPEFEMKKQFDMVLKELNLFFEISKSDLASDRAPSPKQPHEITEPLEANSSNCKETLSSPEMGCHRDASTDDADEDRCLQVCGGDPVVSCDGEQEVPFSSHVHSPETCLYSTEKRREPCEMEQRRQTWSPSFTCLPLLEQLSHRAIEQPKRLEPLRTCTRPIRIGLSKRAKTKHLHHPHPYK